MRPSHMLAIASLIAMGSFSSVASAATVWDYVDNYRIDYSRVWVDGIMDITTPKGQTASIPISFEVILQNEQLPYSAADPILAGVDLVLEEYFPSMPVRIHDAMLAAAEAGVVKTVDAINEAALGLPDTMNLVVLSERMKTVQGDFEELDVNGKSFSMVGSLDATTGILDMMGIMKSILDPVGDVGTGNFYMVGVDEQATVKGVTVHIAGDFEFDFELIGLNP